MWVNGRVRFVNPEDDEDHADEDEPAEPDSEWFEERDADDRAADAAADRYERDLDSRASQ